MATAEQIAERIGYAGGSAVRYAGLGAAKAIQGGAWLVGRGARMYTDEAWQGLGGRGSPIGSLSRYIGSSAVQETQQKPQPGDRDHFDGHQLEAIRIRLSGIDDKMALNNKLLSQIVDLTAASLKADKANSTAANVGGLVAGGVLGMVGKGAVSAGIGLLSTTTLGDGELPRAAAVPPPLPAPTETKETRRGAAEAMPINLSKPTRDKPHELKFDKIEFEGKDIVFAADKLKLEGGGGSTSSSPRAMPVALPSVSGGSSGGSSPLPFPGAISRSESPSTPSGGGTPGAAAPSDAPQSVPQASDGSAAAAASSTPAAAASPEPGGAATPMPTAPVASPAATAPPTEDHSGHSHGPEPAAPAERQKTYDKLLGRAPPTAAAPAAEAAPAAAVSKPAVSIEPGSTAAGMQRADGNIVPPFGTGWMIPKWVPKEKDGSINPNNITKEHIAKATPEQLEQIKGAGVIVNKFGEVGKQQPTSDGSTPSATPLTPYEGFRNKEEIEDRRGDKPVPGRRIFASNLGMDQSPGMTKSRGTTVEDYNEWQKAAETDNEPSQLKFDAGLADLEKQWNEKPENKPFAQGAQMAIYDREDQWATFANKSQTYSINNAKEAETISTDVSTDQTNYPSSTGTARPPMTAVEPQAETTSRDLARQSEKSTEFAGAD